MREEERLSLREASEALGISEVTARRWIKSGKLRAAQPGRRYLIPRSAVEDLLQADSPKASELFSMEWTRTADDAEFYRMIVMAPEEDTDRLDKLSGELHRFISRPVRRILTERNNKVFEDQGPEPNRDEYDRMKERFDALYAEVKRRRPPFARLRISKDGNECRWLIPPDQWDEYRESVDEFFDGEPYADVDAREEVLVYEEEIALSA